MSGFLASVRNLQEATIAAIGGADLIDLKAPEHGSLGAVPLDEIAGIVAQWRGVKPISATVGDLPMEPHVVAAAVAARFDIGVDYVKVGIYGNGDIVSTLRALEPLAQRGLRMIAVLFADEPDRQVPVEDLVRAGFRGCMLDTLSKTRGSLTETLGADALQRFVAAVREHGLLCGLAGALNEADIPLLLPLRPDYLGFRGALCRGSQRTAALDSRRVERIAAMIRDGQPSAALAGMNSECRRCAATRSTRPEGA